ncbi:MAG: 4-hydroxy-3-methylbut-2-enyl diphosphate reductase [Gemmataceae bacterium]|nr:4-hydroxy-3-methylbut-2-enyl diphosphate reductase [Gemmataceae bacterium]
MQVILADVLGMCFGVRDALAVIDDIDRPDAVTIHGELVHNEKVIEQLHGRGFHMVEEDRRTSLPVTDTVLITAHGVSRKERRRLEQAGKRLIDTTCPLVTRAHDAAQKLQSEGCHVLVIGKPGHVEVEGIIGDLDDFTIVPSVDAVREYPHRKLGIMCQTTTPADQAERIRRAVEQKNPHADVRFIDTVCHPTKDHQKALEKLLDQVQAVVVVGGRNSNNTKQLVRRCADRGVPAFHVQDAADLRPEWFDGIDVVGLTAGTSTLEATIRGVHQSLRAMRSELEAVR